MKKSKFLKKSLAMLLALMLVVAMIPLGAAASTPRLQQVDVAAGGEHVQLVAGSGANTYTGDISNLSQDIVVDVLVATGNSVWYTNMASSATDDSMATALTGSGKENVWQFTIEAADRNAYLNSDGDVEIKFSVADADKPATRLNYTILLDPVYVSTDTTITKFTLNSAASPNVQLGETVIQADDIYFTVPYDNAPDVAGTQYRIRELELASATATVSLSRDTGMGATEIYYTTEATTQKIITDGNPNVTIQDGDTMTITNNGSTKNYTIHITSAPGFVSFTTEEALDSVLFTDTGDIAVLLPWGYSHNKSTVTVTPEFTLDYPSSWVTGLDSGDSMTISTSKIINGNTPSTTGNFHAFGDDCTNKVDWADRTGAANFDAFMTNVEYYEGAGNKGQTYAAQLEVNYSEEASRTYNVYFFETQLNNEALIHDLTIGSETAVIDQDAKTIDITVPMGTDISNLNNGSSHVAMALQASNNADVEFSMTGQTATTTEIDSDSNGNPTRNPVVPYSVNGVVNCTNEVKIRVESEDGLTENWYTLKVTVADEFVKPALTDVSLRSTDGTDYEGQIVTENGINLIKFTLPYEVYNTDQLADWNLFYTKTVGSTITFTNASGVAQALPRSGSALTGNEAYLPQDIDDVTRATVALDLHVTGEELSAMATSYYIEITREEGKKDSTLDNMSVTVIPNFTSFDDGLFDDLHATADVKDRFVFSASPSNGTVDIVLPWSYVQQLGNNEVMPVDAVVPASANSRIFFVMNSTGDLVPFEDNLGSVYENRHSSDTMITNGMKIVVLSEQMWVSMVEAGNIASDTGRINRGVWNTVSGLTENRGLFTEYTFKLSQATAEKDNFLEDLRLVDGTGWTAPLSITTLSGNGVIEGTIPYALTSDLEDPKTWNPVYLEYSTSPYAFVLGVDVAGANAPTIEPNTQLPTAGTDRDGVFVDIADYLAMYDNNYDLALAAYYSDGNPFFLIDRDGTVVIYNGNGTFTPILDNTSATENTAVRNMLAVTNENGKSKYQQYTINLTVAAANTGCTVSSFYFEEYPSYAAVIDDSSKTITVTLPYGTEYTYLTPNYTVSEGAIVTIDDPELQGKPLFPGYTDVNFSTTRKMTVIAENESDSTEYTIRVRLGDRFTDVSPNAWYYANVMEAAADGYVSGYGDGTFGPTRSITRAEFAAMIANVLGSTYSNDVDPAFKDVTSGSWANGAIAFCAENGIISGYEDGTFQPNKTITRQEAASMLRNAFHLTGSTGELFPDDSAIAGWAKENVYAVKHYGLMKGDADTGNFRPTSSITRAEAASIMVNADRAGLIG